MRSFSVFTALALITTLSQAAPAPVPVPVAVADPRRLTREEDLPHHRPDLIRLAHLQPDTNAAPDDGGNTDKPKTNFYRFANDGLDLSSSRNGGEEEEEEKPLAVGVPVLIAEGSNAKTLRNELDRERRSRVVIAGNEQEGERGEGGMVLAKNGDGAAEQGRRKLKTAGTSSSSNSRLSSKAECIAVPWYCHSACLSYIEPQFNPTMSVDDCYQDMCKLPPRTSKPGGYCSGDWKPDWNAWRDQFEQTLQRLFPGNSAIGAGPR